MDYYAIIGDLIDSRDLGNRNAVQKKMAAIFATLNQKYSEHMASDLDITLGDEFQCLLDNSEKLIEILEDIEAALYPVKVRFGIGKGKVTTDIVKDSPFGMDGQAYYFARDCINEIKSSTGRTKQAYTAAMIKTARNDDRITLINAVLMTNSVIKSRWSELQWQAVIEYRSSGSQVNASKKLGITQSALQQRLTNADYYNYNKAVDAINDVLMHMDNEVNGEKE